MRAWWLLVLAACGRIGFDATGPAGWFDPRFQYRIPLTIDHTKVAGPLTDFPVLVQLDSPTLTPPYVFVGPGGHPLAYELDHDAAQPDRLLAWVKVGDVSSTVDTTGYLYYGPNVAISDTSNPPQVWTSGYRGVYHFGDGSALSVDDSLATNPGANSGVTATAGHIGGAGSFDGNSNMVVPTTGLDATAGQVNTLSFWLYFKPTFDRGVVAFTDAADSVVYDLWFEADGCEGFNTGNGEVLGTAATGLTDRWIYVVAVFLNGTPTYSPASTTSNALYLDGVAQALSSTCSPGVASAISLPALLDWGSNVHGSTNYRMVGMIDEARMAVGARTPAWIRTEFANQSDPTSFVTAGPIEMY